MNGRLEFTVDSIAPSGQLLGRNHELDIPLGTTFNEVRKTRVERNSMDYNSVDLGAVASIALTLKAVEWYQRNIDVIPGGHSAGLTVEGTGLEALIHALREASDGEYISIAAS
ncbi:MAG: hypothetical protein K8T25_12375 [Planctomycetia bacterium]|nr:hypothetical protein [Planctomycetia bacterium]